MTIHNSRSAGVPRALLLAGIAGVLLLPVIFFVVSHLYSATERLPILGNKTLSPSGDTIYHQIPNFHFVTHENKPISLDSLAGKIHVADFFFTTCPGICPKLSKSLEKVHTLANTVSGLRLVSYSIDPKNDSIPALAAYAQKHHANPKKWSFVRGSQDSVFSLAFKGYLVPVESGNGPENGFLHSQKIILVDKQFRIRGFYDGLDPNEINRLLSEIKLLIAEYEDLL